MTEIRKGHIHRVVETLGMGYIAEPEKDRLWSFVFSQLAGYAGQSPQEIGLLPEAAVTFTVNDGALANFSLVSGQSFSASSSS